jgi:ADP-ribose pyrophosphatase YjhB (NUDIX family)
MYHKRQKTTMEFNEDSYQYVKTKDISIRSNKSYEDNRVYVPKQLIENEYDSNNNNKYSLLSNETLLLEMTSAIEDEIRRTKKQLKKKIEEETDNIDKKLILKNKHYNVNNEDIIIDDIKPRYNKVSYGIILFRKSSVTQQYEVLLSMAPISYAFIELAYGRYVLDKTKYLDVIFSLINNITPHEKRLLGKFDFPHIFFYINGLKYDDVVFIDEMTPQQRRQYDAYLQAYKIFNMYIVGNRKKIIEHINNSYNKHVNLWQIPKGRPDKGELPLDCAIREMWEETGMASLNYDVMYDMKPIVYNNIVINTCYTSHYYIAMLKKNVSPKLKYKTTNTYIEVVDIRWVPLSKLELFISNEKVINVICSAAKHLKKRKKNQRYLNS